MSRGVFARCCAGGMLLAVACKSSTAPQGYEALPATSATVQSALDLFTTGDVLVPTVCDPTASARINCPGGVPGSPVYVTVTRHSVSITENVPAARFDYLVQMKLVTAMDIPITVPLVGDCGLHIDTSPGPDSLVQIVGSASFRSRTPGGPIDELDLSTPTMNNLTSDDVSLSGGFGCTIANLGLSFFLMTLESTITPPARSLCGAPGPKLFVACDPPPPVAYTVGGARPGSLARSQ